jgi:hypothetical protein
LANCERPRRTGGRGKRREQMAFLFDRESVAIEDLRSRISLSRRRMLRIGAVSLAAAPISVRLLGAQAQSCAPTIPLDRSPSNGGPCPYPIPWLDKNGNHNQPAAPNVELSSIYHFKGQLGRCSGFHGMGTDNKGNRLAWGTPTTDYSYMAGEYWSARQAHQAIFAHT